MFHGTALGCGDAATRSWASRALACWECHSDAAETSLHSKRDALCAFLSLIDVTPWHHDTAHSDNAVTAAVDATEQCSLSQYAVDALPAIYLMWHIDSNIANEPSCRGDGAAERAYTSLVTSILQYNHATSFDLDIEVLIGHSDQSKSDGLAGGKHRDSAADAAAKARPAIAQRSDEKKVGNFAKADPHKPEPFPPLVRKWRKFSNPKRKARREAHHAEGPALCTYCKSMRHTYKTCVGLKQDKCNNTTEHKDMYKWDLHKNPRKDIHADGAMWQRPTRPRGESRQGGQCNAPPALATTNGNSDAQRPVELGPSSTAASLTSLDVNEDGRPAPNAQPPPPLPGSNAATTASANPPADPLCHAALRTVQEWRKLLHAQPEPSQGIQVMGLTMSHEVRATAHLPRPLAITVNHYPTKGASASPYYRCIGKCGEWGAMRNRGAHDMIGTILLGYIKM